MMTAVSTAKPIALELLRLTTFICDMKTIPKYLMLFIHSKPERRYFLCGLKVEEILINPKELPDVTVGDVVEIYHPEEEFSRLLLQIKTLSDDFQQKDTVSIEQSIASAFQLKTYQNVYVNKVNTKDVKLDLVEVLFKDQYFSRSDMYRIRNSMVNTCVYLNKKIEFNEMRIQVNELWSWGEKVASGVISEDTRIVFRSSTSVVQIFIQMSSEMWDFDINGDLYFEKAINGFLTDLYVKWKEQHCCHDVTIVMFSRTFYDAQSREEFPVYMQECLQQDYMGRFYEDFYRIVVQNERYLFDEWKGTLKQLRKIFYEYQKRVLSYHKRPGVKVPKAYNSTAAQGNFLETLNMTLNLFEKYNLDRNFDRTGKVAVVITPGAGVFEVDRELTNITKQRTIDCGVGSDLVCMGEQPLHAAPLFKFHSKNPRTMLEVGDDYNIPHWMNHSFYTSKNQIQFYSNKSFVPRIKIPQEVVVRQDKKKLKEPETEQDLSYGSDDDNFPFVDYDEYDSQVFKLPTRNLPWLGMGRTSGKRKSADSTEARKHHAQTFMEAKLLHVPRMRHISDDVSSLPVEKPDRKLVVASSPAVSIPSSSSADDLSSSLGHYPIPDHLSHRDVMETEGDSLLRARPVVGSAGSPVGHRKFLHNYKRHRALINPFAPSRMQFKMTSNRRRWVHAFPTDPHGAAVQSHHVHTYSYHDSSDHGNGEVHEHTDEVIEAAKLAVDARQKQAVTRGSISLADLNEYDDVGSKSSKSSSPGHRNSSLLDQGRGSQKDKFQRLCIWGATGEQEWSPELTTGQDWRPLDDIEADQAQSCLIKPILTADFENTQNFCAGISVDWKSLTMPASLPITTDYVPEYNSLQNDYVLADYSLLPDDVNMDYYMNPPQNEDEKYYRKQPLTTREVFHELISQRLGQGFQLIASPKVPPTPQISSSQTLSTQRSVQGTSPQVSHMSGLIRARPRTEPMEEVRLSIGRIFHKLTLTGPTITVIRYSPRHPHPQMCYSYRYRFQAPDSYNYDVSGSDFRNEKLENYSWNYLDQYICTRGEGDYGLMDSLKFWRSRFFVLPCNNPATKKILDGHPRCDIYVEKTPAELKQLITGFNRYLEILNKMKRTALTRNVSCKHKEFLDKNPGGIPQPDTRPEEEVLTIASPSSKIVEWMRDPECGIPMLPKQHGLPEHCFIAAEVVDWCYYHVKGVKGVQTAMDMLQRVLDDGLIVHASGNPQHKVIYGFYVYCFVVKEKAKDGLTGPACNALFQNDWCEVAILPIKTDEELSPVSFNLNEDQPNPQHGKLSVSIGGWKVQTGLDKCGQTWAQQSGVLPKLSVDYLAKATLLHKYVNVEVDPLNKSDRPEWATARYHAYYSPQCAFELQVQWMVSTGSILGDLINNWWRKASSCGFHLLPVPVDPFALPSAPDSDPLRGPIFIPLNIPAMEQSPKPLFSEYDEDTRQRKLFQLQEAVIRRFGFMPTSVRVSEPSFHRSESRFSFQQNEEYQQYVHCTGGMFIIIEDGHNGANSPSHMDTDKNKRTGQRQQDMKSSSSFNKKSSAELRKDYIARQTSQTFSQATVPTECGVGFLWSWNFMSSRRWRTSNTGDEHFQDRVLQDFREFCSNEENRLREFWLEYQDLSLI